MIEAANLRRALRLIAHTLNRTDGDWQRVGVGEHLKAGLAATDKALLFALELRERGRLAGAEDLQAKAAQHRAG